jgi:glycosyltransferase involved in cell wall biosynthesis
VRILAAIDVFGLIGGSERYAAAAVDALARRGHELALLCGADQGLERPTGCAVTALPAFSAQRHGAAERDGLRRAVADSAPDVVFLLTCRSAATFELLLGEAPLVRFVQDHTLFCPGLNKLYEEGTVCTQPLGLACLQRYFLGAGCSGYKPAAFPHRLSDPLKLLWRKQRELEACRRARRLLVASRYMRSELVQAGLAPDAVVTLPYFSAPVAPGRLPADTQAFLDATPAPLVLATARLTLPDKGVDHLLTALGRVEHDFRCVIAGDGPARAWLEEKARGEGLAPRVHFAGWLAPAPLAALYERARVVAFPSVWNEPFGLVGLEAMAAARPVVAFAVGGVPEWLADGETGFLAPPRDTEAFARALMRLLADERLAQRLGEAGRARHAREFTEELHLQALERELA